MLSRDVEKSDPLHVCCWTRKDHVPARIMGCLMPKSLVIGVEIVGALMSTVIDRNGGD